MMTVSPAFPLEVRPPGPVRWICRTLEERGFETWAVGGAVRDALAGHPSEDWDLTTRAHPGQVRRAFRRTVPVGIDHGTVGVLARDGTMFEVTTFRRDVETMGRHAVVAFADSLDDDLARRDFTINAVAWHPLRQVLHDPFGGAGDMERRILRTVGPPAERFAEDYLRVLRALRFAGRFRMQVDPLTWKALCAAMPELGHLSPERVREELDKVLGSESGASASLALYAASGVLGFFHPELDTPNARARWAVTLRMVEGLPPARIELRLAALLSVADSTASAVAILVRLRSSNRRISEVGALAGSVGTVPWPHPGLSSGRHPGLHGEGDDDAAVPRRRWMMALGRDLVPRALRLVAARARAEALEFDTLESEHPDVVRSAARFIRAVRADLRASIPLAPAELAISGRDLIRAGHRPGPSFGRVLDHLLHQVVAHPERNEPGWLLRRAEDLLEAGVPADDAHGPGSPPSGGGPR